MQKHDRFRELSALAAAGQLSMEEYRELSEHLQACESCRRAGDQYEFILDQLPLPEPSATPIELQHLQSTSYRQRFFERASAQGLHFTREAFGRKKPQTQAQFFKHWRPFAFGAASAALLILVGIIAAPSFLSRGRANQDVAASPQAVAEPTGVEKSPASSLNVHVDPAADNIAHLEEANRKAEEQLNGLRRELAQAQMDKQKLIAELERWKDQAERFRAENSQNKQQVGTAKNEVEKLSNARDQLTASLVAQEFRIQQLSEEVQSQMAAVEREKQLTAAARDVRELMGARNLHIIDVADLDGRGKSKKSFGRVFYTEGKSLIFYAFDLSQKGSASKVSFQAWGQSPGGGSSVKNLGVFHIDDQVQKRWVLRVDKPELLASIESVYVTVEPAPGRDRPSGQKLLYAYLGIPANHP